MEVVTVAAADAAAVDTSGTLYVLSSGFFGVVCGNASLLVLQH